MLEVGLQKGFQYKIPTQYDYQCITDIIYDIAESNYSNPNRKENMDNADYYQINLCSLFCFVNKDVYIGNILLHNVQIT